MPYHKQVDKRLAEVQKTAVLATTSFTILEDCSNNVREKN